MDDYLQELSDLPWINVVESVRAWDQYCYGDERLSPRWTIIHRTFGFMASRKVSVNDLIRMRRIILGRYIGNELFETGNTIRYEWDKPEGERHTHLMAQEVHDYLELGPYNNLSKLGALLPDDTALWLSVRKPWEIAQNNKVSRMSGRFGCGIFHKDAKRVEG